MSEEKTVDSIEAREKAAVLYRDKTLFTGESRINHADGMVSIVRGIRDDEELIAACYLYAVHDCLPNPEEWLRTNFGNGVAELVTELHRLIVLNGKTRLLPTDDAGKPADKLMLKAQDALLRKMVLAMCRDLRVVILRLASRLQTLRYYAMKKDDPEGAKTYGADTLALYAPLANRLGIWQIKWELEDLSLRFTKPDIYNDIARHLDESREARIAFMRDAVDKIRQMLTARGIEAEVSGRPKHIYSIYKKMERKHLRFEQLYDVRALRVIVQTVEQCYEVLSIVQANFKGVSSEYDDYISNPKPNGYRSLHTVILDSKDRPIEIQIRTREMHEYNELGMAAHWRYKEAGNSEKSQASTEDQKVAWLRQLLAWSSDVKPEGPSGLEDDHVYVLTPQGRVVEMASGATPIDFAYHLHSELGHRCRGAKVNGQMVPLNYKLKTGETVEVVVAKTGGPSRDWLNPELGFVVTNRARSKVRQWFHQQAIAEMINEGREIIEKDLARLGKSTFKLEDLAKRLGYETVDDLFVGAAKEEFGLKTIEKVIKPQEEKKEELFTSKSKAAAHTKSQVLVVGVDSLLTQLARCCHPAPPDKIVGFVTRGRGVSIHRADCPNIRNLDEQGQERLIEVSWGNAAKDSVFPVEVLVIAQNIPGLVKDMSEIFLKEKIAIVGMSSQVVQTDMHWRFNVEITQAESLKRALKFIQDLPGVYNARRT